MSGESRQPPHIGDSFIDGEIVCSLVLHPDTCISMIKMIRAQVDDWKTYGLIEEKDDATEIQEPFTEREACCR